MRHPAADSPSAPVFTVMSLCVPTGEWATGHGRGVSPTFWLFHALRSCGFLVLGTALEESFKEYGRNREAMRLCREGECNSFLKKSAQRSFLAHNYLGEGQAWEREMIGVSYRFGFRTGDLSVTGVISIIIKVVCILKTAS